MPRGIIGDLVAAEYRRMVQGAQSWARAVCWQIPFQVLAWEKTATVILRWRCVRVKTGCMRTDR
jgi:hypothetical protein